MQCVLRLAQDKLQRKLNSLNLADYIITIFMKYLLKLTLFVCLSLAFSTCNTKQEYKFPFLDPDLSIDERVNDLVGRMTLDEKIGQLMNQAPAIERLGVPEYNWWSEG